MKNLIAASVVSILILSGCQSAVPYPVGQPVPYIPPPPPPPKKPVPKPEEYYLGLKLDKKINSDGLSTKFSHPVISE